MSERVALNRHRLALRLAVAGLVWSLGLLLVAVLVPVYGIATSDGSGGVTPGQQTLLQQRGIGAVLLVAVPTVVAAVVLVALRERRHERRGWREPAAWAAVAVLAVESLVGIVTIGALMLPAAIALGLSLRVAPAVAGPRAPGSESPPAAEPPPAPEPEPAHPGQSPSPFRVRAEP